LNVRTGLIAGAGAAAGAVLMLSLGWGLQHAAMTSPNVLGQPAPNLEIQWGDQYIDLDSRKGAPIVLNFWASWCGPCAQELPVLANAYKQSSIFFVGADIRDTVQGYQAFEDSHPHPYPTGPIVAGSFQSYGVSGPPTTFFINAGGVVVASFSGPLDKQTLDHYLGLISS
jgi:cytochrome c biogenesis protein CcmG/thiol:disulfide interchange protein DsbE